MILAFLDLRLFDAWENFPTYSPKWWAMMMTSWCSEMIKMILALRNDMGAMVSKVHEITAYCFLIHESFEGFFWNDLHPEKLTSGT